MVAKGVRGGRRGRILQPFNFLLAGWSGRSSLVTLTGCELDSQFWFKGNALAAAFYITELMMRLLRERESHPRLFAATRWAFDNLNSELSEVLRTFEKLLLEEIGYGLDFSHEGLTGRPIRDEVFYVFDPEQGFIESQLQEGYSGAMLLLIDRGRFSEPAVRQCAKQLLRAALEPHLGPAPLLSRRMLVGARP